MAGRLCALCVIFLIGTHAAAFAQTPRDGHWWVHVRQGAGADAPTLLQTYAIGVMDGMVLSPFVFAPDGPRTDDVPATTVSEIKQFLETLKANTAKLDGPKLRDGLNAFYEPFENRRIRLPDAAWIVIRSIAGAPKEVIDALTEDARRRWAPK